MELFRTLTAAEIECRVARCTANGAQLLLYKDARCDMSILDETVGPENWQRRHDEHRGNLFCTVGINVNYADGQAPEKWVWKEDAGAESNTEAEKGHASDSFKRACVNWGIGRELYTAPFIWIKGVSEKDERGKFVCKQVFVVRDIGYDEKRQIKYLTIVDRQGTVAYQMGQAAPAKKPATKQTPACTDCGVVIENSTKRDGTPWAAEDIVSYSTGRFGRCLCPACQRKAFDAGKAGAAE